MQQAALKEKPGLLDVSRIAERIGMDFSDWPGNCYAVACQMLKCKMVKGRPAYGNYHGPVAPSSMFFGKKAIPLLSSAGAIGIVTTGRSRQPTATQGVDGVNWK